MDTHQGDDPMNVSQGVHDASFPLLGRQMQQPISDTDLTNPHGLNLPILPGFNSLSFRRRKGDRTPLIPRRALTSNSHAVQVGTPSSDVRVRLSPHRKHLSPNSPIVSPLCSPMMGTAVHLAARSCPLQSGWPRYCPTQKRFIAVSSFHEILLCASRVTARSPL